VEKIPWGGKTEQSNLEKRVNKKMMTKFGKVEGHVIPHFQG
jgi:hypothetical protein